MLWGKTSYCIIMEDIIYTIINMEIGKDFLDYIKSLNDDLLYYLYNIMDINQCLYVAYKIDQSMNHHHNHIQIQIHN
jgi:hypothetical protein